MKYGPGDVARGSSELLSYFDYVDVCVLCFITIHCLYYLQSFRSVPLNNIGILAHEFVIPFLLDLVSISDQHKARTGREMRLTTQIGEYEMDQVILDLGSDVNVFPKKTWERMGILALQWS